MVSPGNTVTVNISFVVSKEFKSPYEKVAGGASSFPGPSTVAKRRWEGLLSFNEVLNFPFPEATSQGAYL